MLLSSPKLISVHFPDAQEKVFTASDVVRGQITLRLETEGGDETARHKLKDVQISLNVVQMTTNVGGPGLQGKYAAPWKGNSGGTGKYFFARATEMKSNGAESLKLLSSASFSSSQIRGLRRFTS